MAERFDSGADPLVQLPKVGPKDAPFAPAGSKPYILTGYKHVARHPQTGEVTMFKTGEEVWLTDSQFEAFKDKFSDSDEEVRKAKAVLAAHAARMTVENQDIAANTLIAQNKGAVTNDKVAAKQDAEAVKAASAAVSAPPEAPMPPTQPTSTGTDAAGKSDKK